MSTVFSSVRRHHGEASAPEGQDVSWAASLFSARRRAEGHLLKASALTGAVSSLNAAYAGQGVLQPD